MQFRNTIAAQTKDIFGSLTNRNEHETPYVIRFTEKDLTIP